MSERTYAMVRVAKGDYIQPSNDARGLWRLVHVGGYWELYRWDRPFNNAGEWQDPDFLQQLRSQATPVSLNEGESKTIDLKLKKRP